VTVAEQVLVWAVVIDVGEQETLTDVIVGEDEVPPPLLPPPQPVAAMQTATIIRATTRLMRIIRSFFTDWIITLAALPDFSRWPRTSTPLLLSARGHTRPLLVNSES